MSKHSLVHDGTVRDLVFREYKGFHEPGVWSAYHFFVGKECWGFVTHTPRRKRAWSASSFSTEVPKSMQQAHGFLTRRDAGFYIVKTYGFWENG